MPAVDAVSIWPLSVPQGQWPTRSFPITGGLELQSGFITSHGLWHLINHFLSELHLFLCKMGAIKISTVQHHKALGSTFWAFFSLTVQGYRKKQEIASLDCPWWDSHPFPNTVADRWKEKRAMFRSAGVGILSLEAHQRTPLGVPFGFEAAVGINSCVSSEWRKLMEIRHPLVSTQPQQH